MQRIDSNEQFTAICEAGRGVVYNDFSGHGASGVQYNVVHAASCRWLTRSNLSVPKFWFVDLAEATGWLTRERGEEGRAWKRCGTCHATAFPTSPTRPVPSRPTAPTALEGPDEGHAPYVVVAVPGGLRVEAWSSTRLPFEPRGAMRDFRDDLRSAVGHLSAGPSEALHALYSSPDDGRFDVENVLLYNVGPAALRRSASRALIVERANRPVPSPPPGIAEARHHYQYEITPANAPWRFWTVVRPLASFGPVDLGASARPATAARVWYAIRRWGTHLAPPPVAPSVFGIGLVLEAPANWVGNLAAVAKPLLDGVVAALHAHDDPATLDVVASRVATSVSAPVEEVRALLDHNPAAILGARRLLWPWRDGVQWNPADDLCAAILIERVVGAAGASQNSFRLWGSIVVIEGVGLR